jgi:CBS domain-containing protein
MPSVQDVLSSKGAHVHSIVPSASVLDAIRKMNQHKIGALLVMDEGKVVGIFTERDVLRRVMGQELLPANVSVGEVMTRDVICVEPDTDLDEVSSIMQSRKIRHVPVCGSTKTIQGMISIGDLNAYHATHQEATIHFLNEYIYGRA